MPFIDSKVTVKMTEEQKERVKARLGKAISVLHKGEGYLMVGFQDNYTLYFGGKKLEKGAYVEVSLFGKASPSDYDKMTGSICAILSEELGIPGSAVYVTYHGISDWGWNGSNF